MNYANRKYHGDSTRNSRLYRIWTNIKARCNYIKHSSYMDYGGRGISICKEWEYNYPLFKKWALQSGYEETLSIDRKDVNGNYEPLNCRWATLKEQANNTRKNVFLSYDGEVNTIAEWADILKLPYTTLFARHNRGWDDKRVLSEPITSHSISGTYNATQHYHQNKEKINARRKYLRDLNKDAFYEKQREQKRKWVARKKVVKNDLQ